MAQKVTDPELLRILNGGGAGPVFGPPPSRRQNAADARAQAAEARAWAAESRAGRGEGRSDQSAALAAAAADRQAREWAATHEPDGTPKPTRYNQPTEFQSKSAGFLGRMAQAEQEYNAVPEDSRDPRALIGQKLHDWLPNVENTLPVWAGGNSAERQKSDNAARNFIASTLRQESGAAISAGEYDNQYKIFFPQPGDSPEVLAQKAAARRQAIQGFRVAAGPLADQVTNSPLAAAIQQSVASVAPKARTPLAAPPRRTGGGKGWWGDAPRKGTGRVVNWEDLP